MKRILLSALAVAACTFMSSGQTCDLSWEVSLNGAGATTESLPFWAVTNKNGLVPPSHGAFMTAGTDFRYGSRPGVDVYAGLKLTGSVQPSSMSRIITAPVIEGFGTEAASGSASRWRGMVNQLYAGVGWKMLRLDIGMRDRETEYGGLSLTGGDIVWTGNARAMPGYNLQVSYFDIPGTRGIFSVKANYADYKLLDDRYMDGVLLHNKSLFFRFRLHPRVHLQLGLEQWSVWGGVSPDYGKQPRSFNDYLRVVLGMSGGGDATMSDQINVLGDHRGRELIQVDWTADAFTLSFAHDIPFDDGSGMGFQNFPDGVNTIFFSFHEKDRWVSDILYEFVYTKCQSGPRHARPAKPDELERDPDKHSYIMGGNDNYFNNGAYRSGWTYFGQTIGLPLCYPMYRSGNGVVMGVASNSLVAHHFGIRGVAVRKVPYKFLFTWSRHYGRTRKFDQDQSWRFENHPQQFSIALEGELPGRLLMGKSYRSGEKCGMSVGLGLYADFGKVFPNSFGLTVRFSYSGYSKLNCRPGA